MTITSWLQRLMPVRQKDDPTIAEITGQIADETQHLADVSATLSDNVSAMKREQIEMNRVLDDALSLIKQGRRNT